MAALYRGMDRPTLDAAYNNGAAVASSAQIVADWQVRSDRLRSSASELRYGTAERNRIDLFEAAPGAPPSGCIPGVFSPPSSKESRRLPAGGPRARGIGRAAVRPPLPPPARLGAP